MKMTDTIKLMNSTDFKDRFKAEYHQLQNRIESFDKSLQDIRHNKASFEPKSNIKLLDGQMRSMISYKTHLEEIAKLEGIDLNEKIIEQNKENAETK